MIFRIVSIILLVLLFGCSKDENPPEDFNAPEDYVSFYLDDIFIEEIMHRTGRIGYLKYNLFVTI